RRRFAHAAAGDHRSECTEKERPSHDGGPMVPFSADANMADTPPPVAPPEPSLHGWRRLVERVTRDDPAAPGWWLTRFVILRLLGLIYLMAFVTLVDQGPALLGSHGLLPLGDYLDTVTGALGSRGAGFRTLPSIFWLASGDGALRAA